MWAFIAVCDYWLRHLHPRGSYPIQGNIKLICVAFEQISGGNGYLGSEWREEIELSTRKKISFLPPSASLI